MDAATAAIVGAAIGGLTGVVGSLAAVILQNKYQKARDQAERLVGHRREFAAPLDRALGELVALAIRAIPERSRDLDELSIDPNTWAVDWKDMREEQDQLRDTINRQALMSPYRSTVECARAVVQRLDDFAKAESDYEQIYEAPSEEDLRDWFNQASDEEKRDWLNRRESSLGRLQAQREGLLEAAYSLRRHLELLMSRPEIDRDCMSHSGEKEA